ncbi:hypothetical protein LS482_01345 [Sinomicrobium kalidii]|uniref:hypothetical protein n=1 Tax=Sinomicrobium kalidii TaxID=2900738 RepID=UPI001E5A5621|nr:hypothetical protein [Sinomicrobium kalidii]UGU16526.1 hypothetical protein LS482_01345 [Sinomicrobium kalidii]
MKMNCIITEDPGVQQMAIAGFVDNNSALQLIFMRTHTSFVVNPDKITWYNSNSAAVYDTFLPLSRNRKVRLANRLDYAPAVNMTDTGSFSLHNLQKSM